MAWPRLPLATCRVLPLVWVRTVRVAAWPDGARLQTRVFLRAEPDAVWQVTVRCARMVAGRVVADREPVDRASGEVWLHQDCAVLVLRVVDDCCLAPVLRVAGDCQ